MTRSRQLRRLPLVLLGALAMLCLQACWGSQTLGDDLAAEVDKTAPVETTAEAAPEEPRVVLYMTSWCGYCRKTQKLLDQLDVPYVAKDIEGSAEAAREYQAKAGDYRGVPLLDIDGRIVKGYQAELIHKLVTRLKQQEAKG